MLLSGELDSMVISNLAQVLSRCDAAVREGEGSYGVIFVRRFFHTRSVSSSKSCLFGLWGCDLLSIVSACAGSLCLHVLRSSLFPISVQPTHIRHTQQPMSSIRSFLQRFTLGVSLKESLAPLWGICPNIGLTNTVRAEELCGA